MCKSDRSAMNVDCEDMQVVNESCSNTLKEA